MVQRMLVLATLALTFLSAVNAECANACNGHGKCTSYDMCICNRNWQASDCSERVCQFGLAHVDTPKGDLDMSGDISDADTPVVENSFNYPYGTTEMFPAMQNSDLSTLAETAHYYMECSNKGTCDRGTGECNCFDGFDGASCQRASCPNSCSGHGVCKTIEALAKADDSNIYKLWDREATMGCECDAGYFGADCSGRECKHGIDPLYFDDSTTVKYSTYNFIVAATDKKKHATPANAAALDVVFHDGTVPNTASTGEWAIRFYDAHGEDWLTHPLKAGATCDQVVAALEALPNDVIPKDYTVCTRAKTPDDGTTGFNSVNELDFDGTIDMFEKTASDSDEVRPISFSSSFWETVLPGTFADAMKAGVQADFSGDTYVGYPSSYGNAASAQVLTVGYYYRIKFFGNPGKLKEPEIEIYLDGKRPSLLTTQGYTLITRVYTDGQQGESDDYFADHCDGVTAYVNLGGLTATDTANAQSYNYLGLNEAETKLLKACLGSSDDDDTNNVETYNWDWGNSIFPHLVKLVRSTTTYTDGGYYVALVWVNTGSYKECSTAGECFTSSTGGFRLINPFNSIDNNVDTTDADTTAVFGTDLYEIYTTKGTLALATSQTKDQTFAAGGTHSDHHYGKSEAIFGMASKEIIMTRPYPDALDTTGSLPVSAADGVNTGSVSCEHLTASTNYYCLNKTDIFTLLSIENGVISNKVASYDTAQFNVNPKFINLYSAEKLVSQTADFSLADLFIGETDVSYAATGINRITTDISTNWASAMFGYSTLETATHSLVELATSGSTLIIGGGTYAPANFLPQIGDLVTGTDIPAGTFIKSGSGANWVLSKPPTADHANGGGEITNTKFFRHPQFQIYKFIPAAASTYKYVAECSNRGTCDTASGLCNCFAGYSSDACQTQNSLAV